MLVRLSRRGAVTIPKRLREGFGENSVFEVVRRDDGVIELHPRVATHSIQSWFWTETWQRREREADADITSGRIATFADAEDFLADLDS